MRVRSVLVAAATLPLALGLGPASVPAPVVASDNVEVVASFPDVGAISTAFDPERPVMYVNTLNGLTTYDISDPELPVPLGVLPLPHFENEGMDIGVREDGRRFAFIGLDIYGVTAVGGASPAVEDGSYVIVVEVTDPTDPQIVSEIDTATSTHTVQCVDVACSYLYTSGVYEEEWEVIDLTDPEQPVLLEERHTNPSGAAHQWTPDEAGTLWAAGFNGAAAMDVSDPTAPIAIGATDVNGRLAPYNDFIIHNVERPNANAFTVDEETGISGSAETATPLDGNVLLVTEEDYLDPTCEGGEGTFSTWWIPSLGADTIAEDGLGTLQPLDNWNTELLNTGEDTIAGALCSAHYFTTHQDGFVAQGWYQQGTRILDVRDPQDIKQVGYFFAAASETWHAYWVPQRDEDGAIIGEEKTDLVYTNDAVRGIDVLRVTLPESAPEDTDELVAPILPEWRATEEVLAPASAPIAAFGYACRIPGRVSG